MTECPRVLSIQSHVVSGYVGNKCAVFPLQLLGFEVDPINSVQFSNRVGYKACTGQTLTDKDLQDLIEGLRENELDYYTHILTGFIGSESFLNRISNLVKELKKINPNLIYVCDPVMGDQGKIYVPANLLPLYKTKILQIADIITPNQFELELLTDTKITNIDEAWKSIDLLHQKGVKTVVISSLEFEDQHLYALASSNIESSSNRIMIKIPKLPATFAGTGDLFAALFLGWMHKTGQLKESLERTVSTLQAVLKRTLNNVKGETSGKIVELKLIQSKEDIENPTITVTAESVF